MTRPAIVMSILALAACGSGSNQPDACVRETCASLGAGCGTPSDGCRGTLTCGTCGGGVCGGGGIAGACAVEMCSSGGWCWQNPLPQGNPLFGIFGPTPNDVWAVGPDGTVLRFDGMAWRRVDLGATLPSVWGTSASDVWAVGVGGVMLRFQGTTWQQVTSPTSNHLFSIWGSG